MTGIIRLRVVETRPVQRGHDHYWSVIMRRTETGASFTVPEIAGDSEPGVEAEIRDFVRRLEAGGIVRRVEDIVYPTGKVGGRWELAQRSRITPALGRNGRRALQGRGQQQMWNVMRREAGGFTAADLAILASTDDVVVSANSALKYAMALCAAGVLTVAVKGGAARKQVWRLKGSANTGPKPPRLLRSRMVYDPNTQQIVGDVVAEEVEP